MAQYLLEGLIKVPKEDARIGERGPHLGPASPHLALQLHGKGRKEVARDAGDIKAWEEKGSPNQE